MARRRRKSSRKNAPAQPTPTAEESSAPSAISEAPVIVAAPETAISQVPLERKSAKAVLTSAAEPPRVLAVFPDTSVLRLIRECIGAFTEGIADTTPDAGFGFEMAMQRDYQMFFLGIDMPVLGGERLYDFITKAYINARPLPRKVPGVVFIANSGKGDLLHALKRDARVKGLLTCPLEIARLLRTTEGTLPAREVGR
ncbi:MAG: hypothetical protein KDN22_18195 [Verrucomicrobiae bacterium]|nr:hypothetical protein [Verrucomicrobiae bacterium]